jgi:Retrotransposon gag protein/Zinc knuckle
MNPETDSERLTRVEDTLAGLLASIQQLIRVQEEMLPLSAHVLPSISNPAEHEPAASRLASPERDLPPMPSTPPHFSSPSSRVKPASPNDFSGERTQGRAFLNSCELYITLASHQFADDQAKIMWVFSFMKSGRAARFVDQKMRMYQTVGSLPYSSWQDFSQQFVEEFCPKNEILTARTALETAAYFQGARTVDEYVDDFREMVDKARYFEGAHIVLKFRQGLNAKIQDHVACLTQGRPSDEVPSEWYSAAILCDENRIANAAFVASPRTARPEGAPSTMGGILRRVPPPFQRPNPSTTPTRTFTPPSAPTARARAPPVPSASSHRVLPPTDSSVVCFRCGEPGHLRPNCPRRFDIRYLSVEERQAFMEDEFAALDVREANQEEDEVQGEKREQDFGLDNEA